MKEEIHGLRNRGAILKIGLCVILLALVFTGIAQDYSGKYLRHWLDEKNGSYMEKTEQKALSGFLVLSTIKAGLSIIEGSTVNLALADIQFGDIVQSILDAVDITWKLLFTTLTILMSLRFLLLLTDQVSWYFLAAGLIGLMLSLLLHSAMPALRNRGGFLAPVLNLFRKMGLFLVLLFLFFYLLIPLSVFGSSLLSSAVTESTSAEAIVYIETFNTEVSEVIQVGDTVETDIAIQTGETGFLRKMIEAPAKALNYPRELLGKIKNTIIGKMKLLTLKMISLLVCFLFDVLLFPVSLFLLSYVFLKAIFAGIFNRWDQSGTLEDFERFSAWYRQRDHI